MEKEKGLSETTKWLMLGTAIFFDVVQWILVWIVMDWLVVLIACPTFVIWSWMAGEKFSAKTIIALAGGTLVEGIPIIGSLPVWTGVIFYLTRVAPTVNKVASVVPGGKAVASVAMGSGKKAA